tara:strand:+ start:315 stop:710 length:396 start_codon:yes stop_codon:yes gene_type:complete
MIVDTSAIVAFLAAEPEASQFRTAIARSSVCRMSAFNVFECRTVIGRRFDDSMLREFELLLLKAEINIEPFDAEQAVLAHRAYEMYGKGSGHPAALNLGDCAAFALAKAKGEPLLFKGDDFAKTDIGPAQA